MNIKSTIKNSAPLYFLWKVFDGIKTKILLSTNVRSIPNQIHKRVFGREVNWKNPTSLIEKIYWLQLYTDTSLWTKCADKYRVRKYVKDKGSGETLNILYGKWNNAKEIDWNLLPEQFVLKTNNSCGKVILVKNKKELNIPQTIKELNSWLDLKYGYRDAQFHYTKIEPCIIAEELFINKENPTHSLVDYKIWCFHGKPECVLVVYNRTKENYLLSLYDLEWNNISKIGFNPNNKHVSGVDIPKPASFDQMIEHAKKLSKEFPEVRVDFYDVDGKAIFGEMTFTTGFGYFSDEYYEHLGSKIDLSKVKKLDQPNNPYRN